MSLKKVGIGAALAAAAIVIGGSALASADTTSSAGTSSSSTSGYGMQGAPVHTAVTGAELAKVGAAVKAKDSTVTVTTVQKDADGSYDVDATKAGSPVRFEVSADLATITQGGGRGGHGGPGGGGSNDTAVTGAELTKVTAAMKAKDSTVTVAGVRKDPDGSYDVMGTKAGAKVRYDVSADLATFTADTGGGGGHGGPEGSTGGSTSSATPSA